MKNMNFFKWLFYWEGKIYSSEFLFSKENKGLEYK